MPPTDRPLQAASMPLEPLGKYAIPIYKTPTFASNSLPSSNFQSSILLSVIMTFSLLLKLFALEGPPLSLSKIFLKLLLLLTIIWPTALNVSYSG